MQASKLCPKCNTPNRLQARFCAQCGQPLGAAQTTPVAAPTLYCPRCRAPNYSTARRCERCGQALLPAPKPSTGRYLGWAMAALGLAALCCVAVTIVGALGILLLSYEVQASLPAATLPPTSTRQPAHRSPTPSPFVSLVPPVTQAPLSTQPAAPLVPPVTPALLPTDTPTLLAPPGPFAPQVGAYAPDFTLPNAATNEMVSLSQFYGQPVLINFWATWCVWCVEEMPDIEAAYQQHQAEGLVVLAVNVGETQQEAYDFARRHQLTFTILLDADWDVSSLYNLEGYPTSIFVRPDGMIAYIQLGSMDAAEIAQYLSLILK